MSYTWSTDSLDHMCHHTAAATEEVHWIVVIFGVNHIFQQSGSLTQHTGLANLGILLKKKKKKRTFPSVNFALNNMHHTGSFPAYPKPETVAYHLFLNLYLFILSQTLCITQNVTATIHLQQQRFCVAVLATACAAGHGDVLHCTEMLKTRVAAHFVHRPVHGHFVLALDRKWQEDITLFQRLSLVTKMQHWFCDYKEKQ